MCKVYSKGCIHCINLAPKWEKMKTMLGGKVDVVDIEAGNQEAGLAKLKSDYAIQSEMPEVNGYPTIFRVENGKVEQYGGSREPKAMADWALRGKLALRPAWRGGAKKKSRRAKKSNKRTKRVRFFGLF